MPFQSEENDQEVMRGHLRPQHEEICVGDVVHYDPSYEVDGRWEELRGQAFIVGFVHSSRHKNIDVYLDYEMKLPVEQREFIRLPSYAFKLPYTREADWEV